MTDPIWLVAVMVIPALTGIACLTVPNSRLSERANVAGAAITLIFAAGVVVRIVRVGSFEAVSGILYVDQLSALMIGAIGIVGFAGALTSIGYLRNELAHGAVPQGDRGIRLYYAGLHAFVLSMLATVSVDNLGLLWVGVEATTLASALLVGFSRSRASLEAAWKYLILCTVGITCALFGVLLTYYAARVGSGSSSLDWSLLSRGARQLDPDLMRLAFAFVLVGFGMKAGLAPLHTWLADAHSQAPSPVSGMLSGVLLSCALYGILRFHALTTVATNSSFSNHLLLGFGLLSVAVAVPFILLARDLKRLLAYSSVEHMGLMAIAFGIGGPLGISAGLLHLLNHAATKTFLFFIAGDIVQRYGTRRMPAIRGLIKIVPVTAWLLIFGVLAITGAPPFGIFVSEIAIVGAGFNGSRWEIATSVAVVLLIGVVFAAFLRHLIGMVYGAPGHAVETRSAQAGSRWASNTALIALVPLLVVMFLFGVHVPESVRGLFSDIAGIIEPASREVAVK